MKVWFKVELEKNDSAKQCCKCNKWESEPHHVFCECIFRQGGFYHLQNYLSPEMTNKYMCCDCAKENLI